MTISANYTTNHYEKFTLQGDGLDLTIDLSVYRIAAEDKFGEEAFWLTLESENLWNDCGAAGVFNYKVYYDQVKLHRYFHIFLPLVMEAS